MKILEFTVNGKSYLFEGDSFFISKETGAYCDKLNGHILKNNQMTLLDNKISRNAMYRTIEGYFSENDLYQFSYVHPSIEEFKKENCHLFKQINGKNIFKEYWYITPWEMIKHELMFATNYHVFYATNKMLPTDGDILLPNTTNEDIIALYIANGSVCANGDFAFMLLDEVINGIKNGNEETVLLETTYTNTEWENLVKRV